MDHELKAIWMSYTGDSFSDPAAIAPGVEAGQVKFSGIDGALILRNLNAPFMEEWVAEVRTVVNSAMSAGAELAEVLDALAMPWAEWDWLEAGVAALGRHAEGRSDAVAPGEWRDDLPIVAMAGQRLDWLRRNVAEAVLTAAALEDSPALFREATAWMADRPYGAPASMSEMIAREGVEVFAWFQAMPLYHAGSAERVRQAASAKKWDKIISDDLDAKRSAEDAEWARLYPGISRDDYKAIRAHERATMLEKRRAIKAHGITARIARCPDSRYRWSVHVDHDPADGFGESKWKGLEYPNLIKKLDSIISMLESPSQETAQWLKAKSAKGKSAKNPSVAHPLTAEERAALMAGINGDFALYSGAVLKYWSLCPKGTPALVRIFGRFPRSEAYPYLTEASFNRIKKLESWRDGYDSAHPEFTKPPRKSPLPYAFESCRADDHELAQAISARLEADDAEHRESEAKREAEAALERAKRIEELTASRALLAAKAEALGVSLDDYEKAVRAIQHMTKSRSLTSCRVCGRTLSDRRSVIDGIGPECRRIYGVAQRLTEAEQERLVKPVPLVFSRKALAMELGQIVERRGGKPAPVSLGRLIAKLQADGHTVEGVSA